jgi:hypothetical protein
MNQKKKVSAAITSTYLPDDDLQEWRRNTSTVYEQDKKFQPQGCFCKLNKLNI